VESWIARTSRAMTLGGWTEKPPRVESEGDDLG
jgi:hypothetical protein